MPLKEKYKWIKHLDFILIDLFCLMISFVIAHYIRFNDIAFWTNQDRKLLFVMMCMTNILVMFLLNPYSGILKRRYTLQVDKEAKLIVYQIISICVFFFLLKIGSSISRALLIMTYTFYSISTEALKYIRKKVVTGEWFAKSNSIKSEERDNLLSLEYIDERSKANILLSKILKRGIDICAGLVGCIILVPLTLVVYVANRLNGEDGPIFFVQDRIGKNGKIFKMYKFRSMCVDADDKLEEFLNENPEIKEEFMVYRKIKNDPRITKIGKFLRKTSIDEWPQFISILKGDMSLVGPRPYLPREREDMGIYYDIIIQDIPGLTGLWQVRWKVRCYFYG